MQLSEYLQDRDMTQAGFAELCGVNQSAVAKWATGQRIPRREHMVLISRLTGGAVQPGDFYRAGAA